MEIMIGILFAIVLLEAFFIWKKPRKQITVKLTEEEERKQAEIKSAFDNLMNYDYEIAVKKVNK